MERCWKHSADIQSVLSSLSMRFHQQTVCRLCTREGFAQLFTILSWTPADRVVTAPRQPFLFQISADRGRLLARRLLADVSK